MESPRETAERLAETAMDMPPEAFKDVFDRTLAASSDVAVHSRLMWVAGMYLDRRPGAFQLPRELSEHLLNSQDFDQLLAGLKSIRHSGASISDVLNHFSATMKRLDWEERYAGLYQLSQQINRKGVLGGAAPTVLDGLRTILTDVAHNAPDEFARELAARCLHLTRMA